MPKGLSYDSCLGKVVRLPLKAIPKSFVGPILSGPGRGMWWRYNASVHSCWLGTYEKEKVQLFKELCREGSVVYDIGANAGYYSLVASRLVGPRGKVISFEPQEKNIDSLTYHIRVNRLENVEVVRAAVCDKTGTESFNALESSSLSHLSPEGNVVVETICLDDGWKSEALPAPDLVKIDIEGGELRTLSGAQNLVKESRPTILYESFGDDRYEVLKLLQSIDYQVRPIGVSEGESFRLEDFCEFIAIPL